jgi:D-alanyl-D-alanine carboxypeptidase
MERGGPRACLHTLMLAAALTAGLGGTAQAVTLDDFQTVVDDYLAEQREPEMISGVAAYVSLGDPGPAIEIFAGETSIDGDIPVSGNTLFPIGSITKSFTSALILALEAEGKLDIDQTIGDWLPLYPAWKDVTIRQLLNMTSGLPNYTESPALGKLWVSDPDRHYTLQDLIDYVYPSETVDLPSPKERWFYSNTNYILAGMIAEKAAGMPYKQALEEKLFKPAGLIDIYYEPLEYPATVTERLSSGYFNTHECLGYEEPDCKEPVLAPLVGKDVSTDDMSWAAPAGGIISTPREISRWIRAVFAGKVLPPQQLEELKTLVSNKTGEPIGEVTPDDPQGFSLGLVRILDPDVGKLWFYKGETNGHRSAYLFSPEDDVLVAAATNSHPSREEDKLVRPMLLELLKLAKQAKAE